MSPLPPLPSVARNRVKLLVLAQTPPPLHGQSVMVQAMLDGLRDAPGLTLHHVNFRLSRDNADIGHWRTGKLFRTFSLSLHAIATGLRHGCDTLYYIPAPPGKRGALFRDWLVMALCRPFFRRLILHWHATGLAAWLDSEATALERTLTHALLGRPSLSIALADELRHDADALRSTRIVIVPNGIADPAPSLSAPPRENSEPFQALFLGLCSEEKGLFAAAEAIIAANRHTHAAPDRPAFTLIAAGPFPDAASAARFHALAAQHPTMLRHVGFADATAKRTLFAQSHCLLFPTRYSAEGMPLAALEALAHDRPIVATHWRALPAIVAPDCGRLVAPGDDAALTQALLDLRDNPPASGICRAHYLRDFTLSHHLTHLRTALALTATTLPETRA